MTYKNTDVSFLFRRKEYFLLLIWLEEKKENVHRPVSDDTYY